MNWLKELIVKLMSGRVLTRYMSDPVSWRYNVGSNSSELDASIFLQLVTIRGVDMGLQSSILNLFKILTAYFPYPMKKHPSLFLTGDERLIGDCKSNLALEFEMKDLRLMHYFWV